MDTKTTKEPRIKVGILQGRKEVRGCFNGRFLVHSNLNMNGTFCAKADGKHVVLLDASGKDVVRAEVIRCLSQDGSTFTLSDVTIGISFHWERKQQQTFQSDMILIPCENETLIAINEILLEDYLTSVVSSEMNASAPLEFLKAHAITSRSWLLAMLNRPRHLQSANQAMPSPIPEGDTFIHWYDRIDHTLFDVCADDHCQRYQGISRLISGNATKAVDATRGILLTYNGAVCDARYHKACGGLTENFENAWEDTPIPYLTAVSDSETPYPAIRSEDEAEKWIGFFPKVYCNINEREDLQHILPAFDLETTDFFRWQVVYTHTEIEEILKEKSGIDFGRVFRLVPMERSQSGRIIRLKIEGSKRTITVGKELEIRRWLSRSHLYSSAFVVSVTYDTTGLPSTFTLNGAGWGHGVGLCQIGAAVMATKGFSAEAILQHYFHGAELRKWY